MSPALIIQDLTKTYHNGFQALKGVNLEIEQGDFFALLGPNGAGKTTLLGILSSLVRKSGGKVQIFGHDIDTDFSAAKAQLGLVPQEFNFSIFEKVEQIVINQAGYYGIPSKLAKIRAEKYLKALGLWEKRRGTARMLSGGMKRRLMIARALVHEPKLLILDEPTAGVDVELRRSMWDFLREINQQGITIILTTHYLEEAESLCKNIAIINQGNILERTDMPSLLSRLAVETYLLDLNTPLAQTPTLPGFTCRLISATVLEVAIEREQGLSALFAQLTANGIEVLSLKNKVNRLEELFISMTRNQEQDAS